MSDEHLFAGFTPYESKPITRWAMEVGNATEVATLGNSTYEYKGVRFKAHQLIRGGDFIVRLTKEDTYHVERSVFIERNVVPGEPS